MRLKDNFFEAVMLWAVFANWSRVLLINREKFNPDIVQKDYTLTNKKSEFHTVV